MAQLVARLVRNEKVGGSNPPSSTTGRHAIRMSVFCMPGRVVVSLVVPLVFRAPSGPAAREIATREPEGSEWSISRPALALPPPTSTAARPSGPSGALHTGGACSVCRLNVWPGPATAHGRRRLALRLLRHPSHLWAGALACAWRVDSLSGRTAVAGVDSRETVNTFAGVCSVFGETDDTIASQIHPFLALFHRAKASWVSYRRPEVPALVLTVTCCGAVSSMGAT